MSIAQELERLVNLLKEGMITREEFEEEKAALRASRGTGPGVGSQPNIGGTRIQTGTYIGSYRITGVIGEGGMGSVYRGRHRTEAMATRQGGDVAIKVMHAHYSSNDTFRTRFEREASLGMKLSHEGIVGVHDLVTDGDNLALVMEIVSGRDMSKMIGDETGPLPWNRARPMFNKLLAAVGYAHSQGVVHRDIKPENVIVSDSGDLKVLDFGIAKEMGTGATKTGTGMGTVDYMAPEQFLDAKTVDQRADIYALGMTLYEMLAGRLPWEPGTTEYGVLKAKAENEIPPPTDFYPAIPPLVVEALTTAISVDKSERFSTCQEFSAALNGAEGKKSQAESGGGSASSVTPPLIIHAPPANSDLPPAEPVRATSAAVTSPVVGPDRSKVLMIAGGSLFVLVGVGLAVSQFDSELTVMDACENLAPLRMQLMEDSGMLEDFDSGEEALVNLCTVALLEDSPMGLSQPVLRCLVDANSIFAVELCDDLMNMEPKSAGPPVPMDK